MEREKQAQNRVLSDAKISGQRFSPQPSQICVLADHFLTLMQKPLIFCIDLVSSARSADAQTQIPRCSDPFLSRIKCKKSTPSMVRAVGDLREDAETVVHDIVPV